MTRGRNVIQKKLKELYTHVVWIEKKLNSEDGKHSNPCDGYEPWILNILEHKNAMSTLKVNKAKAE